MLSSPLPLRILTAFGLFAVSVLCAVVIVQWVLPYSAPSAVAQGNAPQVMSQVITNREDLTTPETTSTDTEMAEPHLQTTPSTPLLAPQQCEQDSDHSTECQALFAIARFVGFNNTPSYLHFITTQLNHVYDLAPLNNAASLNQDPRFIETNQQYVAGQISRDQQVHTMVDLIDEFMSANMEQLGAIDYVSLEYHSARLIVLANLALAQRGFIHDANGALRDEPVQTDAEYLAQKLLKPDPQFVATLTEFATALRSYRHRCFDSNRDSSSAACRHLHVVAEAVNLSSPNQAATVFNKLHDYIVDDIAPTSAQRIAVSSELDAFNGYALVQRLPFASDLDAQSSQQSIIDTYVDHGRDNALQALHDANLALLEADGIALRIAPSGFAAPNAGYAFSASTTGVFDSLVDLYRLSESLQNLAVGSNAATTESAAELVFAQNRSRIDYWVGIEDDVFDLLLRINSHPTVEREYLVILNDAGVQAWDLRPVITQIYRNSDPNDYINVAQTGYSLPRHFDHGITQFRWRMLRAD